MTDYLSVEDVMAIHRDQIELYGGSSGIRDQGGLESAVARPQSGYYDGLTAEAASLWESLSQNHPFVDGNKRTAFMSTKVFLDVNDRIMTAHPEAVKAFIDERFAKKEMDFEHLKSWLDENTQDRDAARALTERVAPDPQVTRTSTSEFLQQAEVRWAAMKDGPQKDQARDALDQLKARAEPTSRRNTERDDFDRDL